MTKNFKLLNNLLGWTAFAIATTVYLLTMEPTVSLWDCGEFIATADKLQVGHPPGAPLFLMLARFFALFAGSDANVAMMVNTMSAISSGLTILFLFWTVTHFARKIFATEGFTTANVIVILGSGLIGALAYTFSDTFWFSAVEGEVYALSSLFTALVFWAMLKWEDDEDNQHGGMGSMRWIVLIAYLMGLSIGVHLLNLLAIPAIVFIYYFKKYKADTKGILLAAGVSIISIAFVMYGIIQGSVKVASWFELIFVNGLGLSYDSGFLIYLALLAGVLGAGIYFTMKKNSLVLNTILATSALTLVGIPFLGDSVLLALLLIGGFAVAIYMVGDKYMNVVNTVLLVVTVIMIGYSSYAMIVIRSKADTPMDENNPENAFTFLSYLNREQYGDRPLFFGPYYSAPIDYSNPYGEEKTTYIKSVDKSSDENVDKRYEKIVLSKDYNYNPNFTTVFPRMYSTKDIHISAYKSWGGVKGKKIRVREPNGETSIAVKPTFGENLTFFFTYQLNHMYFRYFMWNFAGRQNDEQGHGEFTNGNWLSGIKFIDEMRLGNQDKITEAAKGHPARNIYYCLPLLLGLIGMAFTLSAKPKQFSVIALLFFFTGIAIVIYLNQTPYQPRERDYAYAGSFYAFAIWIGLAVAGIYRFIGDYLPKVPASVISFAVCLGVPVLMGAENWDDHDRSGRYLARDLAYNYLQTCAPNAIIFTNGDNDTFPLWYAQEVEGIRTDVRVVCLPLLSTDWYIEQMQRRAYESAPLPIKMKKEQYVQGTRDYARVIKDERLKGHQEIGDVMDFVMSDETRDRFSDGSLMNYCPTNLFKLTVDSAAVARNKAVYPNELGKIQKELQFKTNSSYLMKNELAIMSMLSDYDWSRPIYYTSLGTRESIGLDKYLRNEGFAYRLTPLTERVGQMESMIDSEKMYDNLMNNFKWGRMNEDDVYLDHFHLRTLKVVRVRTLFSDLAEQLLKEGKKEKALEVLDRCMELMPVDKVPYDYQVLGIIEAYYKAGAEEKANDVLNGYALYCVDELHYYGSLDKARQKVVENDQKRMMYIFNHILQLAKVNNQNELLEELDKQWSEITESM